MYTFRYIYFLLLFFEIIYSLDLTIEPYLQNATINSINILWETDLDTDSIIEWGESIFLLNTTHGYSFTSYGNAQIHTVGLINLLPDTKYYYRVLYGEYSSDIYNFKTPPESSSENSFRIVAMSDMQRDSSNPNKFYEIIHDGIIDYVSNQYSDDLSEELAMILVPGDLVDNGNSYYQWGDQYFEPAQALFSYVPSYPVFGNHEQDTDYFIKYFHLPENGTPGYDEHWYYSDYSNLRVIGLDSNSGYRIQEQLDWLENVLLDACYNEDIDFVFAQLHHPHKSELWLPGEIDYTGDVITLMEEFSDECMKPSIHFFGHTHGYSRGQSKDHNHLWVNVASAGGNIDYWGEYSQTDYTEFTVTQDEWGFVLVDIQAGEEPQFVLKRISRGNENIFRNNENMDEVTVRLNNIPPNEPVGMTSGEINPDIFFLNASLFEDIDGDDPIASEWEIYEDCDFFSIPVLNEFINMENWYFNENTQESVEISELEVSNLNQNSYYCWTVRYRDSSLGWSEWSIPVSFLTGESLYSENLLINTGGEIGSTLGWIINEGYMESLEEYVCDGIQPFAGNYYFIVGALCNTASYAEVYQEIDLSIYSECIDQGSTYINYGGYLSNWGGDDHPELNVSFLGEIGQILDITDNQGTYNSYWTQFSNEYLLPEGTRYARITLMGTRYAGDDNDSYFDELFVRILQDEDCSSILGDLNNDSIVNVLDVIVLINYILDPNGTNAGDINNDGNVNVLDVVYIVNIILNN